MDNTERKDGGPAYPSATGGIFCDGMSLRDAFAKGVLAGWGEGYHGAAVDLARKALHLEAWGDVREPYADTVARFAYAIADRMLEERDR